MSADEGPYPRDYSYGTLLDSDSVSFLILKIKYRTWTTFVK